MQQAQRLNSENATNVTGTKKVWIIKRKVTEGAFNLHFFRRHSADDEAFTTASYIISKPLEANVHNTNTLSSKAIQLIPGSWHAAYLNEYKYWFIGRTIEIAGDRIKITYLEQSGRGLVVKEWSSSYF